MKNFKKFIISLILTGLVISDCGILSTDSTYVFKVVRIGGHNIEDIDLTNLRESGEPDELPLEIKLENYEMGSRSYEGSVKLAILGWEKIEKNLSGLLNGFTINTEGRLGPVEFLIFSKLEIKKNEMKGLYCRGGPLLDTTPMEFRAVRK